MQKYRSLILWILSWGIIGTVVGAIFSMLPMPYSVSHGYLWGFLLGWWTSAAIAIVFWFRSLRSRRQDIN